MTFVSLMCCSVCLIRNLVHPSTSHSLCLFGISVTRLYPNSGLAFTYKTPTCIFYVPKNRDSASDSLTVKNGFFGGGGKLTPWWMYTLVGEVSLRKIKRCTKTNNLQTLGRKHGSSQLFQDKSAINRITIPFNTETTRSWSFFALILFLINTCVHRYFFLTSKNSLECIATANQVR